MRKFGKIFKPYDDNYFISAYGDVYSKYSNKLLKHSIDIDGYHRVDIHGKHKKVHKLVYAIWVHPIKKNMQINHYDDNKNNNHWTNLYEGTQKENVYDQFKNNKRVGNIISIRLYDFQIDRIITFPSISHFINYSGHTCTNGAFNKLKKKKWFKSRYIIISKERVETIEQYKSLIKKYKKKMVDLYE